MDNLVEARNIQILIHEYKKEIISLEKELKKNQFQELMQSKHSTKENLHQEMINLNQELTQLKEEIRKIKENQKENEISQANALRSQIDHIKKENTFLMSQEEQLRKADQILDLSQQNYVYGVYQRRLGPIERENLEITKKIKKCEEDIEKLKTKCDRVKSRYPSSFMDKLKLAQEKIAQVTEEENSLKSELNSLEAEIQAVKNIPKENPTAIKSEISEVLLQIDKDKNKLMKIERKIKEKHQDLKLAKLTFPKTNGSHHLHKEIELLSCILVDKMSELSQISNEIEDLQAKLNSFKV